MIKKFVVFLFATNLYAGPIPQNTKSFNKEITGHLFKRFNKKHSTVLAVNLSSNETLDDQKRFEFGYRYKVNLNLTYGFHLARRYGLRHNEDWNLKNGPWSWENTSSRGETFLMPFIQYRKILNEEGNQVLKLRASYWHNTFNKQEELVFKLGLLSFLHPKVGLLNQIEVNIPTNYNRSPISEAWVYSGVLYNINKNWSLGPQLTYGIQYWNESLFFKGRVGQDYKSSNKVFRVGLLTNLYF